MTGFPPPTTKPDLIRHIDYLIGTLPTPARRAKVRKMLDMDAHVGVTLALRELYAAQMSIESAISAVQKIKALEEEEKK